MTPRPSRAETGADGDSGTRHDMGHGAPRSALIVMDLYGRVLYFGAEATALFGYREDEATGIRLSDLIIPAPMRAAHEAGLARYRTGTAPDPATGVGTAPDPAAGTRPGPAGGEWPLLENTYAMPAIHKDGSPLRIRLNIYRVRLSGQELLAGVVQPADPVPAAPDVPVEASLSAAFYRTLVDRAPLLVSVAAQDLTEQWVSPAAARLFGAKTGTPLIDSLKQQVHPADLGEVLKRLADPKLLEEPYEVEFRGVDGAWHAVSLIAADLRDDPVVGGVVYYGIDVTRAKTAEDRERRESARLVTLLNSLATGVLVEDDERRVQLANPALVDMLGLKAHPSTLAGAFLTGPPPPGVDPDGWAALRTVIDAAAVHDLAPPVGRVVETVCAGIAVNGGSLGRLWVAHDVTSAVAARRALEEHNRQLAALSSLKSEFLSIVSHELRTPLTSISSFTEMLAGPGELTSPDAPAAVAAIARNTDRMLVLVQDLRLLSQLETGAQAVSSGAVDLADLAREIGDGIETGGRVITVHQHIADGPLINGDEQLLRQLVHAVTGTVAACAARDEMTLAAHADDESWTIRASATSGEFVTDEQLLATPLPVLDDASRQRSAALSMLLARAVAQSHGGTLLTEVRPGDTATISVRLPLTGPRGLTNAPD